MLVTLLLCNAACLETLPIYLNKAVSEFWAITISVIGVLFVGEIIPQALCTGPQQIQIAEWCCPVVIGIMYATSPFSWPVAKLLDIWMGEHKVQRFDNDQLKTLILLHSKNALAEIHHGMPEGVEGLDDSLTNMMTGALMIGEVQIQEILTPIYKVTKLYLDTKINSETIKKIE